MGTTDTVFVAKPTQDFSDNSKSRTGPIFQAADTAATKTTNTSTVNSQLHLKQTEQSATNSQTETINSTETQAPAKETETTTSGLHKTFKELSKSKTFKKTVDLTTIGTIASLFSSALLETGALGVPASIVKPFSKFADLANRGFQLINSFRNITTLLPNHDYLGVLGHFWDLVVPFTAKGENYFIARGLPLGQYVTARGINIMNEKDEFKNVDDYKAHLAKAWGKIKDKFFTNWRDIPKNLLNHKFAMFDILSGVFSTAAVVLWKPLEMVLGGFGRKIAVVMVDLGRFCQAFEGMKFGHMRSGRYFMSLAGYSQVLGAITHMLGETVMKSAKKICDPLSFAFSALNRWFQSLSNERGETGVKNK